MPAMAPLRRLVKKEGEAVEGAGEEEEEEEEDISGGGRNVERARVGNSVAERLRV